MNNRNDIEIPAYSDAPKWFQKALGIAYEDNFVKIEGANIHYLTWGSRNRQGLIFVHGGAAHAHWWTHIAPLFSNEYRVAAIDLSGHGDSDHRDCYSLDYWINEIMGVAKDSGMNQKPVIIGHSMGGFITIATASVHGDKISGAIVCDSPVVRLDPEVQSFKLNEAFRKARVYPTVDAALSRFRTVPPQENYLSYVVDYVARKSIHQVDTGYTWKFDNNLFVQFSTGLRGIALPYLSSVNCRLALLRSEFGLVTPDIAESMYQEMGRVTPVVELALAGHHSMLDQPLILLTAIRALLADWQHSLPILSK